MREQLEEAKTKIADTDSFKVFDARFRFLLILITKSRNLIPFPIIKELSERISFQFEKIVGHLFLSTPIDPISAILSKNWSYQNQQIITQSKFFYRVNLPSILTRFHNSRKNKSDKFNNQRQQQSRYSISLDKLLIYWNKLDRLNDKKQPSLISGSWKETNRRGEVAKWIGNRNG